jgi:hypothetical protein
VFETAILTAWPAIQQGGPWVLLVLVAYFMLTGKLMTAKTHDDRVADLRATLDAQQETIVVLLRQKDDLLAGARISVKALDAIRRQGEIGGDDELAA